MKKNIIIISIACAFLTVASSCQKILDESTNESRKLTVAIADTEGEVKASFDATKDADRYQVFWEEGDKLLYKITNNKTSFTAKSLTGGAGTKFASFEDVTLSEGFNNYFVYSGILPEKTFTDLPATTNDLKITELQDKQNGVGIRPFLLWGRINKEDAATTNKVVLSHCMAIVRLTLSADEDLTINKVNFSGALYTLFDATSGTFIEETKKSYSYVFSEGLQIQAGTPVTVDIPCPPVKSSIGKLVLSIRIKDDSNAHYVFGTAGTAKTFNAGHIYPATLKLKKK